MDDGEARSSGAEELLGEEQDLDADPRILQRQEADPPRADDVDNEAPSTPNVNGGPAEGGD
jgi:hypothetical protein